MLGQPRGHRRVGLDHQLQHRLDQRQPDDAPDRLGRRRPQALGTERRLGTGDDGRLAVDQRAVAVEDDQANRRFRRIERHTSFRPLVQAAAGQLGVVEAEPAQTLA